MGRRPAHLPPQPAQPRQRVAILGELAAPAGEAKPDKVDTESCPAESSWAEDENSADEHERSVTCADQAEHEQLERQFKEQLAARGLVIKRMRTDGNCLFRSISDRVYGDAEMYDVVRAQCMDYLEKERDHFSPYVTQDFEAYLRRKRRDGTYGNHLELQALSELYSRPISVYAYGEEAISTFQAAASEAASSAPGVPLRLSCAHTANHIV